MRKRIVVIIAIILLVAVVFFVVRQQREGQAQELEILRQTTVDLGSIAATVNATGTIEPEAMTTISFGVNGTVQELNVQRGQTVAEGDILASLDTGELALAVQQAEDGLRIQELTLEQALAGELSDAVLASSQADIDAAEGNLVIAEANRDAAEASLAQARAQKTQMLAGATPGQIAVAESQVAAAELQQKNAQETYNQITACHTITLPTGEEEEICPGLGAPEEQARANLENANSALHAAETQLADLQSGPSAADIQVADAAIAAAEAQVKSGDGNVMVAEANLARTRAAYDMLLEGPTDTEVAILEAQVESARTNLDLARLRYSQSQIIAPMSGRVASILVEVGELATPGAPAITLVNEEAFHIEVNVDEIDIDMIEVGQPVEVTLDALPERMISGNVADIAPTAFTAGAGVVTYLVNINIESEGLALRPGMTANANIIVQETDNVLRAPNWAIRLDRENGRAYVNRLKADDTVEEVTVTTGLRNEQFSEVTSGLNEGDVIVVTNERQGLNFFGG